MKISKKIIATVLVLTMVLGAAFSSQVIVSPRAELPVRDYSGVPSTVLEQVGGTMPVVTDAGLQAAAVSDLKIASTDPSYLVTPGDVLRVSYLEKTGARPVSVLLTVPVGGEVRLGTIATFETDGKTYLAVKAEIEQALINYSRYSEPVVSLEGLGLFSVSSRGEVLSSKTVRVNGLSKLSDLMYLAGPNASTRIVKVTDRDGNTYVYDMFDCMVNGNDAENRTMRPGDTVVFQPSDRTVVVSGAVMRPGTYQILEGEGLQDLIATYCRGLSPAAGNNLILERVGDEGLRETFEMLPTADHELRNGDVIFIEPALMSNASVSVEGALGMQNNGGTRIGGGQNQRYFYKYAIGETVYDMVLQMSQLFGQDSDLENAYLIRGSEKIELDFADILYGDAPEGRMALQAGDTYFVPFVQMHVSVLGGVKSPGLYGYVPGRTADYYIKLAGGYTALSKEEKGMTITDKFGNALSLDDEITPETVIEVRQDNTSERVRGTHDVALMVTSVIGVVTAVIGLVTTIVNIAQ